MEEAPISKILESSKTNKIRIAGKLTIKDWDILKNDLNPDSNKNWGKAFLFFEKRIKTRYLNPIQSIHCMNRNIGEGFAMVNLQCSLIETIESFYNGWIYQHENEDGKRRGYYFRKICEQSKVKLNNQNIFESFFNNRLQSKIQINGEEFYKNVRCTLLHETQTKKGWIIKNEHEESDIFYEEVGNRKIIYRNNFQTALKEIIEQYKLAIVKDEYYCETPKKEELRKNFKAKFEHICEISKPKK